MICCSPRALAVVAAVGIAAAALPAEASTQKNLNNCKAQLVLDGHVDAETKRVRLVKAKRKTITLEIEGEDGSEREVTCRISKGKVVGFEEQGQLLAAKPVTLRATN